MIIAIEYKNGRIKEFDTSAFTTTNAMSAGDKTARNVITELDLRLDLVETAGLRLDFYWYDATPQGKQIKIPGLMDSKGDTVSLTAASRRLGTSVLLCSQEGIKRISRVIVQRANGSVNVLWRQGSGDWLINGSKFEGQRVLSYTDGNVSSLNSQAVGVYTYLEMAHPEMSEKDICNLIGYPLDAYKEIQLGEAINKQVDVNAELIESAEADNLPVAAAERASDALFDDSDDDEMEFEGEARSGRHFAVDEHDGNLEENDDPNGIFDV